MFSATSQPTLLAGAKLFAVMEESEGTMETYRIGDVGFSPEACELTLEGTPRHIQPQVRDVLLCLVRHANQVVCKETLFEEAWHGRPASDESLSRCISLLRKQLSDRREKHLIETIPKVGYRLHLDTVEPHDPLFPTSSERDVPRKYSPELKVRAAITGTALVILLLILLLATT